LSDALFGADAIHRELPLPTTVTQGDPAVYRYDESDL
jgi:hypothetical protein